MRIILLCLVLTATSTAHAAKPPFKHHIPPIGMRFLNTYYTTDSSGNFVSDSISHHGMEDDVQFVIAHGVKKQGRSDCIALWGPLHKDTTYISYAKNGDLWVLHPIKGDKAKWEHLMFSLPPKKPLHIAPIREEPLPDYVMMHRSIIEVLGNDTVTVGGNVYNCIVLRNTEIRRWHDTDYTNTFTYWYSPEIGYLLRVGEGWNLKYFLFQQLKDFIRPKEKD